MFDWVLNTLLVQVYFSFLTKLSESTGRNFTPFLKQSTRIITMIIIILLIIIAIIIIIIIIIKVLLSYDCFKKFQNPISAFLLQFKSNIDSISVFSD